VLKNTTYKKKNKILLIGGLLLIFMLYELTIKKTIAAYKECEEMNQKLESATNAPFTAAQLQKELVQMDTKIGNQDKNKQDQAQALLELVTNYCQDNQAILREFPEPVEVNNGDLLIRTTPFSVEGDFSTLLKLVYMLEQKVALGKIASVHYVVKKDLKTKIPALIATIYIQNIKKNPKTSTDEK
jgi:hypothetical protein